MSCGTSGSPRSGTATAMSWSGTTSVTTRLMDAEATGVNAFNVHALTRAIEEFQPDVAYVWMIVGIGGLGMMATIQHLKLPWLWHLMDDVPVSLCRSGGRVIEPLAQGGRPPARRPVPGLLAAARRRDRGARRPAPAGRRGALELGRRRPARRPGGVLQAGADAPGDRGRPDRAAQGDRRPDRVGRPKVRERGFENIQVDIYGNVEDHYFPTLVRRLKLDDHVTFKGSRPQLGARPPLSDV